MKRILTLILPVFIIISSVGCIRKTEAPIAMTDAETELHIGAGHKEKDTEKADITAAETDVTSVTEKDTESDGIAVSTVNETAPEVATAPPASKDTGSQQSTPNNPPETAAPAAEDERPMGKDPLHRYRLSNDMGSSRFLNGRIDVYCFFVDDDESAWDESLYTSFINWQVMPALDFLANQAKRWGIDLSFNVKSYYSGNAPFSMKYNGTVNKNLAVGGSTKDVFRQIAVNMGYASDDDFAVRDSKSDARTDEVYLTFISKDGVSYARNMYSKSEAYHVCDDDSEHAVIFRKGLNSHITTLSYKETSDTIAHEILHLFGGEDFYGEKRIGLAEQYCRSDIMLQDSSDIDQMEITEVTAFCLGWTDNVPELCYNQTWIDGGY